MAGTLRVLYGAWSMAVFAVLAVTVTSIALVLPGLRLRRRAAQVTARTFFLLIGVPLRTRRECPLPGEPCVVVANHASYLDGIILTAALPPGFCFVIKREILKVPVATTLLKRLGSEFVERVEPKQGSRDARRLLRKASRGTALAFFPEGTFVREPGLLAFRNGAFAAASRSGLPVVPVIIRGSRQILPAQSWLPRPGALEVIVTAPLDYSATRQGNEVVRLRDAARARILNYLDEPDRRAAPA